LSYEVDGRQTLAVEMEGAAIAQVCHEHNVPYTVIRTISDKADHSAAVDFQSFVTSIASQYAAGILEEYFHELADNIRAAEHESIAFMM
jgi:adenosylhomocysteine nucleosidase